MTILQVAESFGLKEGALGGSTNVARRTLTPARAKALAECSEIWGKAWNGDRLAALLVNEAMTTSDLFVSATGDLLDRELLAQYTDVPVVWNQFASRTTVRNFKPKKLVDIMGGKTKLEAVPELTEFPGEVQASAEYSISASKFGRRFGFSWEAGINDDIDQLRQIPGAYARAAEMTEEDAALAAIATVSTGAPLTSFFKSYNTAAANLLGYTAFNNSSTNALTSANLETALIDIAARKDAQGSLIPVPPLVLVVGKALEWVARRILGQVELRTTPASSTVEYVGPNYLNGAVQLVIHPYLAGNSWFLFPTPGVGRPAVAVAFLAGYETPDLRVSNDTGTRVGGGAIPAEEGNFDVDGVWYRVRHVTGGATVDPIHTYGSTGATGTAGL